MPGSGYRTYKQGLEDTKIIANPQNTDVVQYCCSGNYTVAPPAVVQQHGSTAAGYQVYL